MQPLYFLPDCSREAVTAGGINRTLLAERGLALQFADVAANELLPHNLPGKGPGDRHGLILTYQTADGRVPEQYGYDPEAFDWSPLGDGSLAWIGICKAAPPREEDLRRKKQFSGYVFELGDGRTWSIPTVRRPDGTSSLPCSIRVNPQNGKYEEKVRSAYRAYWEASAEVCEIWFGDKQPELLNDKARLLKLAVDVLSLNYRYTLLEQNAESSAEAWPIVDSESLMTILMLSIDLPGARSLIEKKSLESPATPST